MPLTIHHGCVTLHTNDGDVDVALRDGQVPVNEYDQGCNPWDRGEKLISLEAASDPSPRWGKGWTVKDAAGEEHWLASNWDSSD